MNNFDFINNFLPPAIFVTIVVFLVKFFGKAVSDQKPFADDRDWQRDLDGVNFFARNIFSPIVGLLIFQSKNFNPFKFTRYDFLLFTLAIVVTFSLQIIVKRIKVFLKSDKLKENVGEIVLTKSALSIVTLGIIFLLMKFYNWGMYFYVLAGAVYLFIYLIGIAVYESLKVSNILLANIYFSDGQPELKKCRVMKINEDNVRITVNRKPVILNKSLISRIEIINHSSKNDKH